MLVSVVIPACAAETTIARCVASLLAQSWTDWEAIVVSDDGRDYAALLAAARIADPRLRFVSTGEVRSGCHNARNVGLAAARGELVAELDADDLYEPPRLAVLAPLAAEHGAAVDRVRVVSDATGRPLYTAPGGLSPADRLSAEMLMDFGVPFHPVLRRQIAARRLAGIEYAEDVIANLRLIERLGPLPASPDAHYQYRVVDGSLCHDEESGLRFETAYSAYLDRLADGDAFGLVATRETARHGFSRRRALNRRFMAAQRTAPELSYQDFMTPHEGSVSRALAAPSE